MDKVTEQEKETSYGGRERYVCCYCAETFYALEYYKIHLEKEHQVEYNPTKHRISRPEYECPYCARHFFEENDFASHLKYEHRDPDPYYNINSHRTDDCEASTEEMEEDWKMELLRQEEENEKKLKDLTM